MSEEKPSPGPDLAWGEKPGPSRRSAERHPAPPEEETAPPAPAASAEGVENSAPETEALSFVRSFVQKTEQDKMRFVEQVGILCTAKTVGSFSFFPSDLLIQVVEILMPWASSLNTTERKRAAEVLARICRGISILCGYNVTSEFPAMGQLAGCLTLCLFDSSEMVAYWAAEGLCHLYAFAARCKGKSIEEQEYFARLLRREKDGEEEDECKHPLENATVIPLLFKGVLSPEEVSGIYLTALRGLQDNNAHNTQAAVCMERVLRVDRRVSLGKVSEIVGILHGHLDSFQNRLAWEEVIDILHVLKEEQLSEVVFALLRCSPQCDSSATTLWGMLVSRSTYAKEVLSHLMACLQGQPQKPLLSKEEVDTLRSAAAHAFPTLLEQPPLGLRLILQERWETAFLNLVFWISHVHQGVQENPPSHLLGSARADSERLARSSAGTLQRLLEQFRPEVLPEDGTIWPLLGSADTFHHGVSLLFRALNRLYSDERQQVVEYVMAVLNGHDGYQTITAMTIFAELLRTPVAITEEVLRHLRAQLSSPNAALHQLALDGLLRVAEKPEQVRKLLPHLPEAAKSLQESDEPKAQKLFGQLRRCLERITTPALAEEVAGHVLPLFDAESHWARSFAIQTFGSMLGRGATRALEDLALRSLAPLLLHLHDQDPTIVTACWETLEEAALLLGQERLWLLFLSQDKESVCLVIAKRFRKGAKSNFLQQILEHLQSPQVNIREAAIRILGLVGQETRDEQKLKVIHRALTEVSSDPQQSVRICASHTSVVLKALHEGVPPRWSLRERMRRIFRPCC